MSYVSWAAWIGRHRGVILITSLLVCLLAALSITRLRFELNVVEMLPRGRPAFDDFRTFVADFGELDELVVLIDGAPPEALQSFADALAARLAELDAVAHVHARIDIEALSEGILGKYLFNYLSEGAYSELAARLTPQGIDAQVAADRAMLQAPFDLVAARMVAQDPLGVRRLALTDLAVAWGQGGESLRGGYVASRDGAALLVFARPKRSAFDIAFSERLMREVRAAEVEARAATGVQARVRYTGSYAFALEDAATMRKDIARYVVLALAGVLAVFVLGYRNLRILPFVTYPLILTTLVTFALSLLLFDQLNVLSLSFAAILYGLSIDSGIHFYTRFLQERRTHDRAGAVAATLAGLGRANLTASLTTAAAFVVMGFSCLGTVSQIGWLTAVGMLLNTAEFFSLYPALAFAVPEAKTGRNLDTPRLAAIVAWSERHWKLVLGGTALVALAAVAGARQVASDVELTHLRPRDSEAARVQAEIADRFGSGGRGGAVLVRRTHLEQALRDAESVSNRLRTYAREGLLASVRGADALLPSEHAQRARLARYEALPRAAALESLRAALARQGFVVQRFEKFLSEFARPRHEIVRAGDPALDPLAFVLDRQVRQLDGSHIVAVYVEPAPGVGLRTVAERLRREMGEVGFLVASRGLLEEELGWVLRSELRTFFGFSVVANALLLWRIFRSVRAAAAILVPVLLVVLVLFGAMGVAGVPLDPINLVVVPLVLGLGVDYGVYVLGSHASGVEQAVRCGGRALAVTALTTVAGFGFLGLSRYPALSTLGILSGAGLILSLLVAVTLLPAIMRLRATWGPAS